jgi:hypothetical protein
MAKLAGLFFSVVNPVKIGGVLYRPAVCYAVPGSLEDTIADLAAKGLVKIYPQEMRFVTGVAYPVKKEAPQAAPQVQAVPVPRERKTRSREF